MMNQKRQFSSGPCVALTLILVAPTWCQPVHAQPAGLQEAAGTLMDDRIEQVEAVYKRLEAAWLESSRDDRIQRMEAALQRPIERMEVASARMEATLQRYHTEWMEGAFNRMEATLRKSSSEKTEFVWPWAAMAVVVSAIGVGLPFVVPRAFRIPDLQQPAGVSMGKCCEKVDEACMRVEAALQQFSTDDGIPGVKSVLQQLGSDRIDGLEAAIGRMEATLCQLQTDDRIERMAMQQLSTDDRVAKVQAALQLLCADDRVERVEATSTRVEESLKQLVTDNPLEARYAKMENALGKMEAALQELCLGPRIQGIQVALRELSDDTRKDRQESFKALDCVKGMEKTIAVMHKELSRAKTPLQELKERVNQVEAASARVEAALLQMSSDDRITAGVETVLQQLCTNRIDGLEAATARMEVALQGLSSDGRIGGVEATSTRMEEALRQFINNDRIEAQCAKMEVALQELSLGPRMKEIEAVAARTEAALHQLSTDDRIGRTALQQLQQSTDERIDSVKAASARIEAALQESASNDRIDKIEVALRELSDDTRKDRQESAKALDCVKGLEKTIAVVHKEQLEAKTPMQELKEQINQALNCVKGTEKTIAVVRNEQLEAKTPMGELKEQINQASLNTLRKAEWDVSGMQFAGKKDFLSRKFTIAGLHGLQICFWPQGDQNAMAGNASLFLNGPPGILVNCRMTVDGTTRTFGETLALSRGWTDFCKAGTSFKKISVELLEVVQKVQGP